MKCFYDVKKLGKLSLALGLGVFLYSCTTMQTAQDKKDYELVIVHTNDVHGRAIGTEKEAGYAKIEEVINDLKKDSKNKNVMYLDAGDTFHGTPFATLGKGESIAKILDQMELKAMTLGNHDFNYGKERTKEINEETKFEIIASNVVYSNGENFTKKYIIEEIAGEKVGIFGLSTPETLYKTNPKNVEGLIFKEPATTAKEIVKELQEKDVKFIILLSHLGIDESTKKEWRSTFIAENVTGINLILDGHSHTVLSNGMDIKGTSIAQTGKYGENVGVVKVDFDEEKDNKPELSINLINAKEIVKSDEKIENYISTVKKEQDKITEAIVAKTPVKLNGEREFVRAGETNLSNLVADSIIWKTKADISITNGGGIRASIEQGDISVGDIVAVLPFGNYVVTKELTGKEIKEMLEHGFKDLPQPAGSMAQIGGITLNLDLTKPQGERVSNIKLKNGKKLDMNKKYMVATNDFMAAGGDGYLQFKGKKEMGNYPGLDEILIDYIKTVKKFSEKADGRIKIKK